jgi:hypothetical protein
MAPDWTDPNAAAVSSSQPSLPKVLRRPLESAQYHGAGIRRAAVGKPVCAHQDLLDH